MAARSAAVSGASFRWRELGLLLFPMALAIGGFALLTMVLRDRMPTPVDLWPAFGLMGGLLVAHFALVWRAPWADPFLLPIVGCLQALGLVMTYRLAPTLASRQFNWFILSIAAFVAIVVFMPPDLRWLRRYPYFWGAVGLVLLALTLLAGGSGGAGPNLPSIGIGGFTFQPPELVRILLVVFLAGFLERHREQLMNPSYSVAWGALRIPQPQAVIGMLAMWGLSMLLFVLHRDLGQALLFFSVFLVMLYAATGRARYVVVGLALFAAGAFAVVRLFSYVRTRFDILLDPWSVSQAEGFQIVQGLIALAAGGLLGEGLGYGYANYIPAVHTDYIFNAIAEEWGLMGAMAVLGLFALLAARGFHIAMTARDEYGQLLATGLTAVVAVQTLIIVGGNLKLIPLTGVTLSFVSYGGSSLITSYMLLALLLKIPPLEKR
ncbi:MAG: FtsW/RodA/SpoVE family cell cycle protein [Anaerolineae bacterium]